MVGSGVSASQSRNRARKRAGRRPRGVALKDRGGWWQAEGTLRIAGRSVRVRKGLGLPASASTEAEAQTLLDGVVDDLKAQITGRVGRGEAVGIAAERYLSLPRERRLGASTVRIIKEVTTKFGLRRLNDIAGGEWRVWIDGNGPDQPGRMSGRTAATRERFLNTLLAFLRFCRDHHGLAELPKFHRDKKARNPNRRQRRRVSDLRPDLIAKLLAASHIALKAQLVVEWATGARVSSVLYGARLCDLNMGEGRETITFRGTKNGEDVTAALPPSAVTILNEYLSWRGNLHEREQPLFLTPRSEPYRDNGKAWGGQNKTAFNAAKRRAAAAIRAEAEALASNLDTAGDHAGASRVRDEAASDAELILKVTQHWFRHLLATHMVRQDPRAAMEQGGWLDIRSVMGYAHDVPEHRHKLVVSRDDLATALTQERVGNIVKS